MELSSYGAANHFSSLCVGCRVLGNKGGGRKPAFHQSSGALGGQTQETGACFPCGPRVVSGCGKPLDPSSAGGGKGTVLGTRFSVSGIPDTAGHLRRAEDKMGSPGVTWSSPGTKEEEGRERGGTGWFPRRRESLVWSVAGAQ